MFNIETSWVPLINHEKNISASKYDGIECVLYEGNMRASRIYISIQEIISSICNSLLNKYSKEYIMVQRVALLADRLCRFMFCWFVIHLLSNLFSSPESRIFWKFKCVFHEDS